MKVCLINTYDSTGGAAIACKRLMRALNLLDGVDAKMLVASGKSDEEAIVRLDSSLLRKWQFRYNMVYERLQFKPYHNREINEFYFSLADTGIDISSHPAVKNADIIHLHWINLGFLSVRGVRKLAALGKPIVWTMHDMWTFTGGCHYSGECMNFRSGCGHCMFLKTPSKNDLSSKLNGKKKHFRDFQFVTCSNWLRHEAMHSSLLGDSAIMSIHNPIDTGSFSPGPRSEARKFHGLDPEKKYILFAAANLDDKRKGFKYMVEAIKLLGSQKRYRQGVDTELILFGKHSLGEMDLPFKVNSLGSLSSEEAIVNAYRAADLFAIPSLQDNLPNTIVEAMACGTPVVGFNSGGIPEMIDHRSNGYVARYKDADDLAEGLSYVLGKPEFGESARKRALESYDPLSVAGQYNDLYQSLLSNN